MNQVSIFQKDYEKGSVEAELKTARDYFNSMGILPEWGTFELYSVYHCPKQTVVNKSKFYGVKIRAPYDFLTVAQKVETDLKTMQKEIAQNTDIQCYKQPGDKFDFLTNLRYPGNYTEEVTLFQEKGKILLIFFWGTWSTPSQTPLTQMNDILLKNAGEWKDKVQTICVGAEKHPNILKQRLEETPYEGFKHYEVIGRWDHEVFKMYGIRTNPYVILCDKEDTLVFSGYPNPADLEKVISDLIQGRKPEPQNTAASAESISEMEYKSLRNVLKEKGESLSKLNKQKNQQGFFGLGFMLKKTKVYNLGLELLRIRRTKLTINATVIDTQKAKLLEQVKGAFKGVDALCSIEIDALESFEFKYGKTCSKCSIELKENSPQYCCLTERKYYCVKCGENIDDQKCGIGKIVDPHPLLFVNPLDSSDPERILSNTVFGLGQKTTFADNEDEKSARNHPGVACDACSNELNNTTRWKCACCFDLDICGSCFEKLLQKDSNVKETLNKIGHAEESHPCVRFYFKAVKNQ